MGLAFKQFFVIQACFQSQFYPLHGKIRSPIYGLRQLELTKIDG